MKKEEVRKNILELCSEGPYGSWELFWDKIGYVPGIDEATPEDFVNEVLKLLDANLIIPLKNLPDGEFVTLDQVDPAKLLNEFQNSFKPDSLENYWFTSTELGKMEDIKIRSST